MLHRTLVRDERDWRLCQPLLEVASQCRSKAQPDLTASCWRKIARGSAEQTKYSNFAHDTDAVLQEQATKVLVMPAGQASAQRLAEAMSNAHSATRFFAALLALKDPPLAPQRLQAHLAFNQKQLETARQRLQEVSCPARTCSCCCCTHQHDTASGLQPIAQPRRSCRRWAAVN